MIEMKGYKINSLEFENKVENGTQLKLQNHVKYNVNYILLKIIFYYLNQYVKIVDMIILWNIINICIKFNVNPLLLKKIKSNLEPI